MTVTRLHPGPVIPDPGTVPGTATIVGPAPQWDDASDATYGVSATNATGSTSFTAVLAPLDLLVGSVTEILSVTIHLRYSTAYPDGHTTTDREFAIGIFEPDGFGGYASVWRGSTGRPGMPTIPDDDAIHEFTWVVWPNGFDTPEGSAYTGGELLRVFKSGSWFRVATLVPPSPNPFRQSSVTAYEAWVEVEWVGGSMVRQWPNDTGGLTVTPRLYPPPRTGRIHGGHH